MLDYDALMSSAPIITEATYTARDTMLYALGVGAAQQAPTDPGELQLVYEKGLVALPTMAVVIASPGPWLNNPRFGVDYGRMLHGEQMLTVHRPLPTTATVRSTLTVDAVTDKGAGRGALVYCSRELRDAADGTKLVSLRQSYFFRGDGGFGGSAEGAALPHPIPDRAPDLIVEEPTRADQALLYRLSGDYNPLHADPALAVAAGFERPILHGLCSFGVTGRALIKALCAGDPRKLRRLDTRFSAPVLPGDTLSVRIWNDGAGAAAFTVQAVERNLTVLQNGYAEFE